MKPDTDEQVYIQQLEFLQSENKKLSNALDDLKRDQETREYNLTCRALSTTPEGREFLDNLNKLKAENKRLRDGLIKLRDWSNAYPIEVFPEPDLKGVREALTLHGFTIDQVSASNFRWLLSRITETAEKALTT